MMKIMMKSNSIKEIVKGAHNDTQRCFHYNRIKFCSRSNINDFKRCGVITGWYSLMQAIKLTVKYCFTMIMGSLIGKSYGVLKVWGRFFEFYDSARQISKRNVHSMTTLCGFKALWDLEIRHVILDNDIGCACWTEIMSFQLSDCAHVTSTTSAQASIVYSSILNFVNTTRKYFTAPT